ncbi:MAG TPA: hypothetical protein HA367_00995 [Candidatus Methanofastidiosum sp.]|jgi:hypothetical protein|nr:hypothetical protein [Methanofastidiosum sp.]
MNYNNLLFDYVTRTQKNLEFIEKAIEEDPEKEVFEVTQLINSLLGLIVFPFEKFKYRIPRKPLSELENEGWVLPHVEGHFPQAPDLYELMHYLRNAVAHFNIVFTTDEHETINGIRVSNIYRGNKRWEASFSIIGLRDNVNRFVDLLHAI